MRELERFLLFVVVFQFSFLLAGLYESHVDTERMGERVRGEEGGEGERGGERGLCESWSVS